MRMHRIDFAQEAEYSLGSVSSSWPGLRLAAGPGLQLLHFSRYCQKFASAIEEGRLLHGHLKPKRIRQINCRAAFQAYASPSARRLEGQPETGFLLWLL